MVPPRSLFTSVFGESFMQEYFFISLVAVFALVLVGALLALSTILGPRNPSPQKQIPYECGVVPKEEAKGRYPVRFATVAMLFIIFDIEVVFMYPWAVSLDQLKLFGLVEMLVFVFILGIAYVYIWGRGGLEWD